MYSYSQFDRAFVASRNQQFRAQVARRIDGSLTEDEFKPLRLMNGLYLQLHAYMLRVAVPYGTLNSQQMHRLADIADRFDKGVWSLYDPPEYPVQLAKAKRRARHSGQSGRS